MSGVGESGYSFTPDNLRLPTTGVDATKVDATKKEEKIAKPIKPDYLKTMAGVRELIPTDSFVSQYDTGTRKFSQQRVDDKSSEIALEKILNLTPRILGGIKSHDMRDDEVQEFISKIRELVISLSETQSTVIPKMMVINAANSLVEAKSSDDFGKVKGFVFNKQAFMNQDVATNDEQMQEIAHNFKDQTGDEIEQINMISGNNWDAVASIFKDFHLAMQAQATTVKEEKIGEEEQEKAGLHPEHEEIFEVSSEQGQVKGSERKGHDKQPKGADLIGEAVKIDVEGQIAKQHEIDERKRKEQIEKDREQKDIEKEEIKRQGGRLEVTNKEVKKSDLRKEESKEQSNKVGNQHNIDLSKQGG
jgi:hypothetical protein